MKPSGNAQLPRLLNHLKHLIFPDHPAVVNRRDLRVPRHGEVQLELDFTSSSKRRRGWK